jgi:putative flavoprotein involved in K+ transport
MFDADCYWRDLVSFTWNITTAEGHPAVKDLLDHTLSRVKPSHWQIDGQASHADGVTEAWFIFETGVGRGKGLVRLKGDKCWTLLTTLVELKGFEEKKGFIALPVQNTVPTPDGSLGPRNVPMNKRIWATPSNPMWW